MKFPVVDLSPDAISSLPVRGAWIEIREFGFSPEKILVAPRKGSVD